MSPLYLIVYFIFFLLMVTGTLLCTACHHVCKMLYSLIIVHDILLNFFLIVNISLHFNVFLLITPGWPHFLESS